MKPTPSYTHLKSTDALMRTGIELMKTERQAIIAGAFDLLADLNAKKTALTDEIESRYAELDAVRKTDETEARRSELVGLGSILSRRAAENLSLLQSAQRGVKEALGTVNGNETANPNPGLYNATGHKITTALQAERQSLKI